MVVHKTILTPKLKVFNSKVITRNLTYKLFCSLTERHVWTVLCTGLYLRSLNFSDN